MLQLNDTIQQVTPSPTLAATTRARQLQAQGRDVVAFTAGEPDFDTPQAVKDAAVEALNKGYTKYTPVAGIPALREAVAEKIVRDQKVDATPSEVIITNGGKQALAAACAVLLRPGDEAIIAAPYWTSYPEMVKLAGGKPVIVSTSAEQGYMMTPEQLEAACSERTRMVFINTPSNPTGACYGKDELRALAEVISSRPNKEQIVVFTDEVYEYITYDGFSHTSFFEVAPELKENTILVSAFSKSHSMTGWRVGYAYGPQHVIKAMTTHQGQFTSNVCSIAQHACVNAYRDGGAFAKKLAEDFQQRLEFVVEAIANIPGVELTPKPRGAFYAFPTIEGLFGKKKGSLEITCAHDFTQYLLEEYDVVAVQGEAFGDPKGMRLSFAVSREDLQKGLERIDAAARSLS